MKSIGTYYEHRCERILERLHFTTFRMAGSHGIYDVIGFNADVTLAIQVKGGKNPKICSKERQGLEQAVVAPGVLKQIWLFKKGCHFPAIFTWEPPVRDWSYLKTEHDFLALISTSLWTPN